MQTVVQSPPLTTVTTGAKASVASAVLLVAGLLPLGASAYSSLDLRLSSDTVSAEYSVRDESNGRWELGALYNDDNNAALGSVGFNVVGNPAGGSEIQTALGVKGVVHDTFQTAFSLALGGSIRIEPRDLQGIGFESQLYYSPDMLSSNDAERFLEVMARVTYDVHPQARLFMGWRSVTVDYDHERVNEVDLDEGLRIGFHLMF